MEDFDKPLNNRYDPYVTKARLDEYIVHYLKTAKNFPENFRYSNTKLALGFIATIFTIVAHAYPYLFNAFFPKDYPVLVVCCVGYFFFNIAYQFVDYIVCGDIFFTTNPDRTELSHVREISFQSKIDKDGNYKITLFLDLRKDEKLKGKDEMTQKGKFRFELYHEDTVACYFNAHGSLIKPSIQKVINSLIAKISI